MVSHDDDDAVDKEQRGQRAAEAEVEAAMPPVCWYLTECMAGPRAQGMVVLRQRRPHNLVRTFFSEMLSFSDCLAGADFCDSFVHGYQELSRDW
jgi:hypothetical protein